MATAVRAQEGTVRKRKSRTSMQAAAAQYKLAIKYILLVALLMLGGVFMSAYSANLQQKNNALKAQNEIVQAEIDSLNEQINDASSIEKVEKIATEKYGMVQPDESNYIRLKNKKSTSGDLADTIKKEAYN
ncbi:MAG: septum formation initiator family protein [Eubacteriales bacterium]|nr:septum formation initiator family protein [Eubacteriales bacterium]